MIELLLQLVYTALFTANHNKRYCLITHDAIISDVTFQSRRMYYTVF